LKKGGGGESTLLPQLHGGKEKSPGGTAVSSVKTEKKKEDTLCPLLTFCTPQKKGENQPKNIERKMEKMPMVVQHRERTSTATPAIQSQKGKKGRWALLLAVRQGRGEGKNNIPLNILIAGGEGKDLPWRS